MSLIYWDTMLFVYWFEEHPVHAARIRHFLTRMEKAKRCALHQFREAFRPPFVQVLPFTSDAADHYARIRAGLGVSPADAIHLACAAQAGVDVFLTNDQGLARQIVPGIQFIAGLDYNLF